MFVFVSRYSQSLTQLDFGVCLFIYLGLPQLILEGFDSDQIWAELELYNDPILATFNQYVTSLANGGDGTSLTTSPEDLNEDEESDSDQSIASSLNNSDSESNEDEDDDVDMAEDEEKAEGSESGSDSGSDTDDIISGKISKKKKQKLDKLKEEIEAQEALHAEDDDALDKDIEEMERFNDLMEALDEKRMQGELDEDEIIDLNEGIHVHIYAYNPTNLLNQPCSSS